MAQIVRWSIKFCRPSSLSRSMILVIGYYIGLISSDSVFPPSMRLIMLFACIAGAPWMLGIAQGIANALVGAVASAIPIWAG